jgi:CMP/dCMP kinase
MSIRVITLSGEISSGKSSISSALASCLRGWQVLNTGAMFRDFCSANGISIQNVSLLPDSVHKNFDALQRSKLETDHNLILEGRLAGWLAQGVPDVLKVFCFAPIEIRVERYMRRENCSWEQALDDIKHRDQNDVERYRTLYELVDYRSPIFYDLHIDTSSHTPKELAVEIAQKAGLLYVEDEVRQALS